MHREKDVRQECKEREKEKGKVEKEIEEKKTGVIGVKCAKS